MKICHSASEGTQGSISRGGKRGNRGQDSNWDAEILVTGTQGFAAPGSSSSCTAADPRAWPGAVDGGKEWNHLALLLACDGVYHFLLSWLSDVQQRVHVDLWVRRRQT